MKHHVADLHEHDTNKTSHIVLINIVVVIVALTGDLKRVQTIINKSEQRTAAVRAPDKSGYTALHYAARGGHLGVCELLLAEGALVDAKTKNGEATPLHKAAVAGEVTVLLSSPNLIINYKEWIN